MKKLTLALLVGCIFLPRLQADELIRNNDFSQGTHEWRGDVFSGSAQADPFAPSGTSAGGITVPLKSSIWTKVYQEFVAKGVKLNVKVDYKFSPNLTFSNKERDYQNVTHSIGYDAWLAFKVPVQSWVVMISDFGPDKGRYFMVKPNFDTDQVQTMTAKMVAKDNEKKTLTLAFPPGTGTVTLLNVSVTE